MTTGALGGSLSRRSAEATRLSSNLTDAGRLRSHVHVSSHVSGWHARRIRLARKLGPVFASSLWFCCVGSDGSAHTFILDRSAERACDYAVDGYDPSRLLANEPSPFEKPGAIDA